MNKKKDLSFKLTMHYYHLNMMEELRLTEKEFGELITSQWDTMSLNPRLQKKALQGAKKIKELRTLLTNKGVISRTIQ